MRTLAALAFIAGTAAAAIALARRPTIADGQVLAAEILGLYTGQGVTAVTCDDEVPIGRDGAAFACTVTLASGATQPVACTLARDGKLAARPTAPPRAGGGTGGSAGEGSGGGAGGGAGTPPPRRPAIRRSGDPWAD